MAAWVGSGAVLWVIVAGMAVEAAVLLALFRRTGRGVPPGALLPNLASGACLIGAAAMGLQGAWWGWVSTLMLAGLAFHLLDLRLRWRSR